MASSGPKQAQNRIMRSICETCGDEGWKFLLVTCSKCRIACEHRYCMREHSFDTSTEFVCADCSMRPVQNSLTSSPIKAVPKIQRNRVRVESSNPVPRWKEIPVNSKMKLISPEEAKKLSSASIKPTFKVPRPVLARPATGLTNQTAFFSGARSLNSEKVDRKPPSPQTMQIRSGVVRQASKAVAEGSKSKVGDGAKSYGSNKIFRSILKENLFQLVPYRPALQPTWKGRIMDSATPSEFNGEFLAQPASTIREKSYRLSKAIPVLLKVRMVPIGSLLDEMFVNRSPEVSDVEIYIFPYDKNTKRCTEERDYLFEAMKTRNAMIRININDTPLLIFSSKLLDKSSQLFIQVQKQTNNFLWGIFLTTEKALALLPGTSNQTTQHFDDRHVADNESEPHFIFTNHRNPGKRVQRHYRGRN